MCEMKKAPFSMIHGNYTLGTCLVLNENAHANRVLPKVEEPILDTLRFSTT
jgi:hypothetical protein